MTVQEQPGGGSFYLSFRGMRLGQLWGSSDRSIRLPQDVAPAETGGVPTADSLTSRAPEYLRMHVEALATGDHTARATACWGLAARWPDSQEVVMALLTSGDADSIEDAAGILCHVQRSQEFVTRLENLVSELPDSTARDAVIEALPSTHPLRIPDPPDPAAAEMSRTGIPLAGEWEPYTSRIQFIEAPFVDVVDCLTQWTEYINAKFELSEHRAGLGTLLALLDPYWWPSKELVVETIGPWTAVFSNGHDTYEGKVLGKRLGVRSLVTVFSPDVAVGGKVRNYGATEFHLFDRGDSVRSIHISRQPGGWHWDATGTVQSFEDPTLYDRRIKRERFELDALNRYCTGLGISRADSSFYGSRGLLVDNVTTHKLVHDCPSAATWRALHLD